MKTKEKKEKPVPCMCKCGKPGIIVKNRSKKMVSCPDPANCSGNWRTAWNGSELSAILEWNALMGGKV